MRATKLLLLVYFLHNMQKICGENVFQQLLKREWTLFTQPFSVTRLCHSIPDRTLIADPLQCRKFHVCFNNVTHQLECPKNFHFSRTELRCLPGDCQDSEDDTCHGYKALPVATDCRKFTSCSGGKRELQECPYDHYFDINFNICRKRDNSPDFKCRCGSFPNHTILPNEDDCTTFYTCVNNTAQQHRCPKHNYYNSSINSCLPDVNATCLGKFNKAPKTPSQNNFCKDLGEDMRIVTFQPSPIDCSEYQICILGRAFTKRCQKGFYFDAEQNFCRLDTGNKCVKEQHTLNNIKNGSVLNASTSRFTGDLEALISN